MIGASGTVPSGNARRMQKPRSPTHGRRPRAGRWRVARHMGCCQPLARASAGGVSGHWRGRRAGASADAVVGVGVGVGLASASGRRRCLCGRKHGVTTQRARAWHRSSAPAALPRLFAHQIVPPSASLLPPNHARACITAKQPWQCHVTNSGARASRLVVLAVEAEVLAPALATSSWGRGHRHSSQAKSLANRIRSSSSPMMCALSCHEKRALTGARRFWCTGSLTCALQLAMGPSLVTSAWEMRPSHAPMARRQCLISFT